MVCLAFQPRVDRREHCDGGDAAGSEGVALRQQPVGFRSGGTGQVADDWCFAGIVDWLILRSYHGPVFPLLERSKIAKAKRTTGGLIFGEFNLRGGLRRGRGALR